MKKITIILLFTNLFGYAQIDYEGLIKNLEDITFKTDIKAHFKELPFEENYGDITLNDERFLRFHGVIVDNVKFSDGWSGKTMSITFFDEAEDYKKIKAKLIELYGEPETNERTSRTTYEWDTDNKLITLRINLHAEEDEGDNDEKVIVQGSFKGFEDLTIGFKQQ